MEITSPSQDWFWESCSIRDFPVCCVIQSLRVANGRSDPEEMTLGGEELFRNTEIASAEAYRLAMTFIWGMAILCDVCSTGSLVYEISPGMALQFFDHLEKQLDDLWIKMFARLLPDISQRFFLRPGGAVGAVRGERIPYIGDREQAGRHGNFLPL